MKKIFQLAVIAVVALSLTVACKSKTEPAIEDTTPVEMIVEDTLDSIEEVAEEVVVEEPVKKAPVAKKDEGVKKATASQTAKRPTPTITSNEPKPEVKTAETNTTTQKVSNTQKRTESNQNALKNL